MTQATIPPVTPLSAIGSKVADAIAAQRGGNGTAPVVAASTAAPAAPAQENNVETANGNGEKTGPRHKLIQILLEDVPEFRDAVVKAATDAKLSPASWARMVLAEKVNVKLPAPEKKIVDPVEKATAKADDKLLRLMLVRDHYAKLTASVPEMKPLLDKEQRGVDNYIKKLNETVKDEAKVKAIIDAVNAKIERARMAVANAK